MILIIRIKNKAFNLYDADGRKLVFTDWLRTVGENAEELRVSIRDSEKRLVPLRICACKKTKTEIAAEKERIRKMESRKQKKRSEETAFTHEYMLVATSLPAEISASEILSCYRLRWQVELVFKRLKSLLPLGSIPTKTEEAGETWINGKILLLKFLSLQRTRIWSTVLENPHQSTKVEESPPNPTLDYGENTEFPPKHPCHAICGAWMFRCYFHVKAPIYIIILLKKSSSNTSYAGGKVESYY